MKTKQMKDYQEIDRDEAFILIQAVGFFWPFVSLEHIRI